MSSSPSKARQHQDRAHRGNVCGFPPSLRCRPSPACAHPAARGRELRLREEFERLGAIRRFRHDLHVRFGVHQRDQAHAHDVMIVSDEDSNLLWLLHKRYCAWARRRGVGRLRRAAPAGFRPARSSLFPARSQTLSCPSSRLARSDMPSRPKWPSLGPTALSGAKPMPLSLIANHLLRAKLQLDLRPGSRGSA